MQIFRENKLILLIGVFAVSAIIFNTFQNKNTKAEPEQNINIRAAFVEKQDFEIKKFVNNDVQKKHESYKEFVKAARQNNVLQYALKWTFGRKPQKGWYLYVPLMQKTLETEAAPQTPEFAGKIFQWQKEKKLYADGVLNGETLYSIIEYWQSRRVRPIISATENQLLTAPISNFYDSTRNVELLKVEKSTFEAYQRMIQAAVSDKSLNLQTDENGDLSREELFLKLISTYRSPEYQAGLRKKEPGAGRGQLAFVSPHFTGRALDIYVGGEPVTTKDFNRAVQIKTPTYKWLVKNAEKFGFYPYFFEPWHWEYVPENINN